MSLFDTSLSLHRLDINNICAGRIFQLSFGASGVGGETRLKARLQMREEGRYPLQTRGTCAQDELRYGAQTSLAKQPPPPLALCVTELYMGPWPVACLHIDHELDRPSAQIFDRFPLQRTSENGEVCMLKNDAAVELGNKPPTRTRHSMSVIAGYWTFVRDLLSQGKAEISKPTGRYDA